MAKMWHHTFMAQPLLVNKKGNTQIARISFDGENALTLGSVMFVFD